MTNKQLGQGILGTFGIILFLILSGADTSSPFALIIALIGSVFTIWGAIRLLMA